MKGLSTWILKSLRVLNAIVMGRDSEPGVNAFQQQRAMKSNLKIPTTKALESFGMMRKGVR